MRAALLQLCSGDDPASNLSAVRNMIAEAAAGGADFVLTPEVTNCVSLDRERQRAVLRKEAEDETLAALRSEARERRLCLSIGSLALKSGEQGERRFVNRSFLIGPDGAIAARYDKIHMFDVEVSEAETYRESSGFRPGDKAVLVETPHARIGLSICYDLRFPHLYRRLAKAGAQLILVPSAFSPVTGAAHWETLLRARAIETGAFVLAAAQTGRHPARDGKRRETYGHSLAVAPWGEVLLDMETERGVGFVDLDIDQVAQAQKRVPSLTHDRPYSGP